MGFTSTLPLYSQPKILPNKQRLRFEPLGSHYGAGRLIPNTLPFISRRCYSRSKRLVVKAANGAEGGARRRVYRQSQAEQPLSSAPVKQVASFVVPAGVILAASFVLWKVIGKISTPKASKASPVEDKSISQGVKWSFAPGTNLLSGFASKIDRQSKQTLNEFAKELRAFSSVDMSGRNFGDEGLFFLAESLGYNQIVEEVSFAANGITATGVKAFDGVLQSNIMLKTLDLSGNPIGDEGVKCLCGILENNSSIQKLQLNSVDLGDEGAKDLAELLKKNPTLRVLELNNNMIDYSGFTSLAAALLENNTIRNLHLNGNYGGALGVNALAKGLEGNKSLRELHLHGNSIGDEGVRSLMSGLSSHKGKITLLDLGNNSITAKGAFHVAAYLKKSKSLLWVNLYMNDIGDEGAEKIADALKQNRTITTIDLGGNNIRAEGITVISESLKDNTVITNLEVGYNPIGPDGAKALSEVLKFHGNVKTLKLGWCQIGPKGAEFIADMLRYNNTISILDLRANGLRDEGAACLARSLKVVNEALTSLDLGFNEIRDDGAFAIAQALKANEDVTVTSLNLASNFLTKFGQSALTDARDHVYEMSEKEVSSSETKIEEQESTQTQVVKGPNRKLFSFVDCGGLCKARCSLHSRQNVCMRACGTCCARCRCVPPGTSGNRHICGRCYTDMTTHGKKQKCP
ncbi:Leucine-rich repeat, ribonuclease inhibitor subtype [Corchorus capsularis]|uniref:Leucine-rich repeat, ribonuclease inhibitor subtype n=1 Tax=Corchorus capsularis TaxID=210143 RepID=A0A1R3I6I6_COCAP|nr:Leucine-rich repeat, ribonuclease inhibitor subtype [Corchorus capsularis]